MIALSLNSFPTVDYSKVLQECLRIHDICGHSREFAIPNLEKLRDRIWYSVILSKEAVGQVKTASAHKHWNECLIEASVTIKEAAQAYIAKMPSYRQACPVCCEAIDSVSKIFKSNGEIYPVFLKKEGEDLVQIDGLHRMIAFVQTESEIENMLAYVGDNS